MQQAVSMAQAVQQAVPLGRLTQRVELVHLASWPSAEWLSPVQRFYLKEML